MRRLFGSKTPPAVRGDVVHGDNGADERRYDGGATAHYPGVEAVDAAYLRAEQVGSVARVELLPPAYEPARPSRFIAQGSAHHPTPPAFQREYFTAGHDQVVRSRAMPTLADAAGLARVNDPRSRFVRSRPRPVTSPPVVAPQGVVGATIAPPGTPQMSRLQTWRPELRRVPRGDWNGGSSL